MPNPTTKPDLDELTKQLRALYYPTNGAKPLRGKAAIYQVGDAIGGPIGEICHRLAVVLNTGTAPQNARDGFEKIVPESITNLIKDMMEEHVGPERLNEWLQIEFDPLAAPRVRYRP